MTSKLIFQGTGVACGVDPGNPLVQAAGIAAHTVPQGEYWRITSITGVITSTATVGNRIPAFAILHPLSSGGSAVARRWCAQTMLAASKNVILDTSPTPASSVSSVAAYTFQTVPFEPFFLGPNEIIAMTDAAGIDAADQTGIAAYYEIWKFVDINAGHVIVDSAPTMIISDPVLEAALQGTLQMHQV